MDKSVSIFLSVAGETEEDCARALEALSRPIAGLVLDGLTVLISRNDADDETS